MNAGRRGQNGQRSRVVEAARVAGLKGFDPPDLTAVERRRLQLWVMTLLLLVSVAVGAILLSVLDTIVQPGWLSPGFVQAGFLGLVILFCGYAVEKELQLRRLARLLIEERELTAALTNRLGEVSALLESGRALNLDLDLGEVSSTILRCAKDLLRGHDCSLLLLYGEDELRTVKVAGDSAALGARVKVGVGIAGQVAQTREPLLINGVVEHIGERKPVTLFPNSAMSVPLINRSQLLGVLNINAESGRVYSEHDLRAFSLFGEQAAIAITNAQLFESQQLVASRNSYQALHDGLTGLANRSLFLNRLDLALARRRERGQQVAVLFIDLDDFKRINDHLGHAAGDDLLVATGERLKASTRASDTVARLGGDEFGVLVEDIKGNREARLAGQRILDGLARPVLLGGREVAIAASVGVAIEGEDSSGGNTDDLLSRASIALKGAKETGKNTLCVFKDGMKNEALRCLDIEADLLHALERDQIQVFYQPIFSLSPRRMVGVEALARWVHPDQGLLAAGAFIPAALKCGILGSIDRWVLTTACEDLKTFDELGFQLNLHVNLSPSRFGEHGLVSDISETLRQESLNPSRLCLEITEGSILRDSEVSMNLLSEIHSLGARLALDDFGTGYSSLSHLRRYPVDCLKIDLSFIEGINDDLNGRRLVESIVRMGQGLNLEVVAEGVESEAQLETLEVMGCGYAQGFFLEKPMARDDLIGVMGRKGNLWAQRAAGEIGG